MRIYDVSLVMRPGMPVWNNEKGPEITPLRRIARGDGANVSIVSFANHTGTHVDPPIHFIDGANTVDQLPLDALVGPCTVVAYGERANISGAWLERAGIAAAAERILFKTANSALWRTGAPFSTEFIAIDPSAADWLLGRKVKLVGVDYLSVEPFGSGKIGHPVHKALLGAAVVIVEGLDLDAVPPGDYELACGPIKLERGDGAPARVFLIDRGR